MIRADSIVDLRNAVERLHIVVLAPPSHEVLREVGDAAVCRQLAACWPFEGLAFDTSLDGGCIIVRARRTEVGAVVVVGGGWERFHVGEVDELLSRLVELIESNPHYLARRDDDWWPARVGHDGDGGNGAPALIAAHTKPRRFD